MIVDLRSDTVTKPTTAMLEAMFAAKVGDDVLEEDETVSALEEKLAGMFGMAAGLFCPSGTMTNQIAIKCFTQPMDEVICDESSHVYRYEGGGIAFNSAASVKLLRGNRGRLTAELIEPHVNPADIHYPRTSLVVLENTANKGGGSYYTLDQIEPIYHLCRLKKLSLHLDGARIFNALAESGDAAREYGRFFDGISVCLSKGLGAPVGSVLLGSEDTIQRAKRIRKAMGGGMRQAGYLAAAGIYALDHHVHRLKEDHVHARIIGEQLQNLSYVEEILPVRTNIVIFRLNEKINADDFVHTLASHGVKCSKFGYQSIRFVTHLDVNADMVGYTVEVLKKAY
ncbi:low specificity L-threonine aldolase [Arcticibacter sp. MXS-1]|uniref:threonine aldolase family protein n=1 Tax=Arcticibacter sp. MXS-1 TaxID=3341726 RepID=UPI0035A82513